jgi:2-polyprenyl-3-methyl-5-hydroxy-6-metoxy-1,4-benzoquinol methylase
MRRIKKIIFKICNKILSSAPKISTSLSGNEPPIFIEKVNDLNEIFIHIQAVWEDLGKTEPYWSVLSSENFKISKISENRNDFYNSGRYNVETLFNSFERNLIDHSKFKTCLEYGCGVGRVTSWLSQRFESLIGYDISNSHIEIAKKYFKETNNKKVTLYHINKPQDIGNFPKVDVVYSVIVLQHNPPPVIRLIIQELISALNPGGIAFFQVPTYRLGYQFSMKNYLSKEISVNRMEMHLLPQNEIFDLVNKGNGRIIEVLEDNWIGFRNGDRSNTFIIQKN